MMYRLILILFICICVCRSTCAGLTKDEALSLFVEGNLAYREGSYTRAIANYEKILEGDLESGNIYFNLGNSYLKMNEVGKAVLFYERAKKLIPRDSDLKANYRLALSEMKAMALESQMPLWQKRILNCEDLLTLNEMIGILGIMIFLTGLYHLLSLYFRLASRISFIFYLTMGLLVSLLVVVIIVSLILGHNLAVIIFDTEAKFEPREEATTYFDLYQGHKIRIIKPEDNWYKIERPDGKQGWVKQAAVERI